MFLLDTNVVSEMRKAGSGEADENVVKWLGNVDANTLFLSAMTLMELELGILLIGRRDDQQGARLRWWKDHHLCRSSPIASCRSIPRLCFVALRFMYLIRVQSVTQRLRQPRLFTA